MRRRTAVIIPVLLVAAVLFLGITMIRGTTPRYGKYGTNQQNYFMGRTGQKGTNPIGIAATPGVIPGATPGATLGVTPGATLGVTPGAGLYRTGPQIKQQIGKPVGFNKMKADNIRTKCGNIAGVKHINAIVNGDTAIISYSPSNTTINPTKARDMITKRVKQIDSSIKNVMVSDSADFSSRIKRLTDSINSNKPTTNMNTDFKKLMQDIQSVGRKPVH